MISLNHRLPQICGKRQAPENPAKTTASLFLRKLAEKIAVSAWEVKAICDLAARSAREGLEAFSWAGIYGALRWGVSRRSADRLIHHLEELGHIEVVYRGDRHTPRRIRFYAVPLRFVNIKRIWKARLEVERRWNVLKACAHRILEAAPPLPNHCPLALSDDPAPCIVGEISPDPASADRSWSHSEPTTAPTHSQGNFNPLNAARVCEAMR